MNPLETKEEFIKRFTKWMRFSESEAHLDGLYEGKSSRIHHLIRLAYERGVRRGIGLVWESQIPLFVREE